MAFSKKIKVIPQTIEKFSAIKMDEFTTLDSFAFLPSSLDKLAESVSQNMKSHFLLQCFGPNDLPLISR